MWLSWIHTTGSVGPRHVHHRNDNFGKCITVNKGGFLDYAPGRTLSARTCRKRQNLQN